MANAWARAMRYLGLRGPDPRVDEDLGRRLAALEQRVQALEAAHGDPEPPPAP